MPRCPNKESQPAKLGIKLYYINFVRDYEVFFSKLLSSLNGYSLMLINVHIEISLVGHFILLESEMIFSGWNLLLMRQIFSVDC